MHSNAVISSTSKDKHGSDKANGITNCKQDTCSVLTFR